MRLQSIVAYREFPYTTLLMKLPIHFFYDSIDLPSLDMAF